MMSDVWCFTCNHEIRETIDGYRHIDPDDTRLCVCTEIGEECQP